MAKPVFTAPTRRLRGFEPASGLVGDSLRLAGEKRGFALSRLLTQWEEIVGVDLARVTRPVKMGYAQGGFGGTLTVLVMGAHAPMVEMQKDRLRERVNACYGYNAVSRVLFTQTSAAGFAEGQALFAPAPKAKPAPDPAVVARAAETAAPVQDAGLRAALELLARNVLSRAKT